MKQSMKKESQEIIKSRINLPDFSLLNIQDLTPLTKDIIINQPTINILILGDKKKGKTTLVHSLSQSISSKIRAEKEPERNREREKNFSQKIGYINTKLINNNNFKENTSLKNIIIIQNKIDIVMKNNSAKEQYSQIKKYAKNKNAQNSLIIPISAQLKFNLDVLTQYLISIPIPKRDLLTPPKYIIFHSFSFSRSLEESTMIHKNGTLYGILLKGILKLGDNFEILPGICIKTNNKEIRHSPIYGKINIIQNEKNLSNYVIPGGIINLGLKVDSELCKNNILEGNVLGYQEKVGNVYYKIGVKCHFLRKLIQIQEKDWGHHLEYVTDIKKGEVLLLNINFISVGGDIISIKGNNYEEINFELRKPVCIEISEKIAISRKIGNIWRLIGWGEIISNGEEDVIIT